MISEGFVNLLLAGLLVAYTALGGYLFHIFERPREYQSFLEQQKAWNESMANMTQQFLLFCQSELPQLRGHSRNVQLEGTRIALNWFLHNLGISEPEDPSTWDTPWKSTFFAATLYTTIGYGDRAPVTTEGRAAAIIYSLIGIPVMLIILNSWGKLMFKFMQVWWQCMLACMRCFPCLRCMVPKRKGSVVALIHDLEKQEEVRIPTLVAFAVLFSWLCGFAWLYLFWNKEWTFFESFYFFFISLTTIGLGDFVPETPAQFYWGFPMIILGLSVISLCISVIQSNIEGLFHDMMKRIDDQYRANLDSGMQMGMGVFSMRGGNVKDKVLMKMMDKTKLDMLQQKVDSRSKMHNNSTQTHIHRSDFSIQAGDPIPLPPFSSEEFQNPADGGGDGDTANVGNSSPRRQSGYSKFGKRSYIYSVTD